MTDGGAVIEPGAQDSPAPFWPRRRYAGFKAFGSADGAVLVTPDTVSGLRSAAELAARERRTAGGLLYGRRYTDGQGGYLVVDGFLEAGPGEGREHGRPDDEADDFTLPEDGLRLLRADAARMYPGAREAGWWRTRPGPGDFGPGDYLTQQELVADGGAGLLVYGQGPQWGTAYLGTDGHAPDSAGTLVVVPEDGEPDDDAGQGHGPAGRGGDSAPAGRAGDSGPPGRPPAGNEAAPGTALERRRRAVLEPLRRPSLAPARPQWAVQPAERGYATEAGMPLDVKVVVTLLLIVPVIAAVMIGMLLNSAMIALIVAVVCVLLVLGFVWLTRL